MQIWHRTEAHQTLQRDRLAPTERMCSMQTVNVPSLCELCLRHVPQCLDGVKNGLHRFLSATHFSSPYNHCLSNECGGDVINLLKTYGEFSGMLHQTTATCTSMYTSS
jgi:hypothetical protein